MKRSANNAQPFRSGETPSPRLIFQFQFSDPLRSDSFPAQRNKFSMLSASLIAQASVLVRLPLNFFDDPVLDLFRGLQLVRLTRRPCFAHRPKLDRRATTPQSKCYLASSHWPVPFLAGLVQTRSTSGFPVSDLCGAGSARLISTGRKQLPAISIPSKMSAISAASIPMTLRMYVVRSRATAYRPDSIPFVNHLDEMDPRRRVPMYVTQGRVHDFSRDRFPNRAGSLA